MNLKLIRWQLPFSYAAIALLATLALGAVMLVTLRGYYTDQEQLYMLENASLVRKALAPLVFGEPVPAVLQAQVKMVSAVTSTRVRVLDNDRKLLADSGSPVGGDIITFAPLAQGGKTVRAPAVPHEAVINREYSVWPSPFDEPYPSDRMEKIPFTKQVSSPEVFEVPMQTGLFLAETISSTVPVSATYGLITVIPAGSQYSAFGERFPLGKETRRSSGSVALPLLDISGQLVGQIQLSEGPGFGWAIVTSVMLAWAAAGIIAILLSAAVGWRISRRVTAPLTALTGVTERMAAGDLSARAWENKADEFGDLARSFNGMAGRVEETVLALRNFVSDAAHELQTPLTALRTNLELALGEREPDRQTAFLHRAEAQVERLSSLAQDLLDLSRLEAGTNQDAPAPVDLAGLLREVSEGYAARAEQGGQTFTLEIPPDVPLVPGDETQLRRAISNLLDNAVKFTPAGGSVRARLERAAGEVRLVVEDTGIGIPSEDLPSLFSRFHRGRNAAGYPGSGLGLAIVRAIAQSHGGRVTAENLPTRGSRFTFSCSVSTIPTDEQRRQ